MGAFGRGGFGLGLSVAGAQRLFDTVGEVFAAEGLGQKMVCTRRERIRAGNFPSHRRDKNDLDVRGRRLAAENFAHGKAIDVGQAQVQEDDIRQVAAGLVKSGHAGLGADDFKAGVAEIVGGKIDEVCFIIDHKNLCWHSPELTFVRRMTQRRRGKRQVTNRCHVPTEGPASVNSQMFLFRRETDAQP